MNKDVIYIDVDDDVTAIIGKIKEAKEKVVALVPPKRAGALQSAVNLRLLERMARTDKKKLVLVTNNQALMGLAANANIPVAKNLQSKPELAAVPALVVDDGDDIIDGSELPVGDHADTVKGGAKGPKDTRTNAIESTDLDIDNKGAAVIGGAAVAATAKKSKKKNANKIPNFDSFRKKLVFGIIGGAALVGLLIWMFVFAPAATVVITARTEPQSVSAVVELGGNKATNYEEGIVSSTAKEEKVEETVEFTATGEKNVGEKAGGTVRFSTSSFGGLGTIPAGTELRSSSGLVYITDEAVTLTYQGGSSSSGTTTVTAAESGTKYNGATGSLSGAPSQVSANFVDATTGGTSEVVKVVSSSDVQRAYGELIGKSTDERKGELAASFGDGMVVIDSSFAIDREETSASPAVGEEAPDGKGVITVPTTYSMQAVAREELDVYLDDSLEAKIDTSTQKIYDTGVESATLANYNEEGDTQFATLNATGSIGPDIDEAAVKEQVKGKRYGEVQQTLESVNGIQEADTQFSYFWVRTVPDNTDKITIEFKVEDE